ncbi:helix-turn-helix domain-containing protein [Salinarimonas ramus]|uniref:Transcriptional regulator n=1 Tax=Salinarimonas ramus TaxID=690164 RepID=A0A917V651_9HYPH|nr:helix-turn-helix domain-containing protein [Salinarimonas ramus]GGK42985.1 transcriptional regulator [Salinarimonas ramus]
MENRTLASRIRFARTDRRMTLDALADASGVSRAALSRIERGEASPTATLLARIAAGLGTSVASLFSEGEQSRDAGHAAPPPSSALSRAADQPSWQDPQSGYVRRNVSPAAAKGAAEIVDVTFPPGERVVFDNALGWHGVAQQVWVLDGTIEMTVGTETSRLFVGDCLFMRLDWPVAFHNPGETPARYAVVLSRLPA